MSSIKAMLKSLLSQELFSKHKCDSQSSPHRSTGRHRRSPPRVQDRQTQQKVLILSGQGREKELDMDEKNTHTEERTRKALAMNSGKRKALDQEDYYRVFWGYKMFPVVICWLYHSVKKFQPLRL